MLQAMQKRREYSHTPLVTFERKTYVKQRARRTKNKISNKENRNEQTRNSPIQIPMINDDYCATCRTDYGWFEALPETKTSFATYARCPHNPHQILAIRHRAQDNQMMRDADRHPHPAITHTETENDPQIDDDELF